MVTMVVTDMVVMAMDTIMGITMVITGTGTMGITMATITRGPGTIPRQSTTRPRSTTRVTTTPGSILSTTDRAFPSRLAARRAKRYEKQPLTAKQKRPPEPGSGGRFIAPRLSLKKGGILRLAAGFIQNKTLNQIVRSPIIPALTSRYSSLAGCWASHPVSEQSVTLPLVSHRGAECHSTFLPRSLGV
jgi:hypothetical protein